MELPKQLVVAIHHYLEASASEEERQLVEEWYRSVNGVEELPAEVAKLKAAIKQRIWLRVQESTRLKEVPFQEARVVAMYKKTWFRVSAAAILLGILSGSVYLFTTTNKAQTVAAEKPQPPLLNDALPGGNKAVLTLAGGTQIVLDSAENGRLARQGNMAILKLQDGVLAYNTEGSNTTETGYNSIATPRGGQYRVVLPDGSKVWLNAATSLRYPVAFTGRERTVELNGEGYFEIEKNAAQPFKVKVDGMEVEVTGTHFNVMAYSEETTVQTTLLEGAVKIHSNARSTALHPGEQAKVTSAGFIEIIQDADTGQAVAWKNGLFKLSGADLPTILRQMERWYDVQVVYRGNRPQGRFTGTISRNMNLSNVLKGVSASSGLHITMEGKNIIVP